MTQHNEITVVGNLTADPELRYTQGGIPVANITIASSKRVFDRQTNEWKDTEPTFFRASVWRELGEHVAGSFTKGQRVIATGQLKQQNYEDSEGKPRSSMELEVDDIGPSLKFGTTAFTRAAAKSGEGQQNPQATAPVAAQAPVNQGAQPVATVAAPAAPPAPAPQLAGVAAGQSMADDVF